MADLLPLFGRLFVRLQAGIMVHRSDRVMRPPRRDCSLHLESAELLLELQQVIRAALNDADRRRAFVPFESLILRLAERERRAAERLPAEGQLFFDDTDFVGVDDPCFFGGHWGLLSLAASRVPPCGPALTRAPEKEALAKGNINKFRGVRNTTQAPATTSQNFLGAALRTL
jgi:hypothetical protein